MKFLAPINGDLVHARDGVFEGETLSLPVKVSGDPGKSVTINGIAATEGVGVYTATVPVAGYPATLTAQCGDVTESIHVYVAPDYAGKFRVSIDDAIWFLRDIAEQNYASIFETPFLAFFRELHEECGLKLHINLYLKDNDTVLGEGDSPFGLADFPDCYKAEWQENADWIRLSFHAKSDLPASPYATATYDELYADATAVRNEIARFAGEELLGPVTTLHWGAATVDGCRALRDAGWPVQVADFNVDDDLTPVSYYLNVEQRRHMKRRFVWKDETQNILFVRSAIITDTHPEGKIAPFLDAIAEDPVRVAYLDILIHEQYFHEKYPNYQANYCSKVREAVQWALDHGYTSAFLDECIGI